MMSWRRGKERFGGDLAVGYRESVEAGLASPVPSPFDRAADGWILGSDAFVERIRGVISPDSKEPSSIAATGPAFSFQR